MVEPRASKVAVVEEVRERLEASAASVVTEYRGLSVKELADLRRALAAVGGDYKIFKNTLVRRAVAGGDHQALEALLTGPTGIAFVREDITAVAKALRDFSRTAPNLVLKGGLFEGSLLDQRELVALADLPSREQLLARLAGAIAAPLQQLAALVEALPRNLAYGLSALVDQRQGEGGAGEPAGAEASGPEATDAEATDATAAGGDEGGQDQPS